MNMRLAALVTRYWFWIIVAWLVLAGSLRAIAPRWQDVTHDGDLVYLPAHMPSVDGERLMARAFPERRAHSQIAIVVERRGEPLGPADLAWTDRLAARFETEQTDLPILDVWTRHSEIRGEKLLSRRGPNGQAAVIVLQLGNEFMAADNIRVLARVRQTLEDAHDSMPVGLQTGVSGSGAIGGDMMSSAAESIKNTEWATVMLVIAILLLVYRAPLLAAIPLVTIGVALTVSIPLLALLTRLDLVPGFGWWNFKVFTTTKIFIVVILFGSGTDFCLFLISRYKEELERGLDQVTAVGEAVARVGNALVGSALTTIVGLGMMFFADFGKFANGGPAIALCLLITLIACLTLAPALVRAFGRTIFWPFDIASTRATRSLASRSLMSGFWNWAASAILRHPGTVLVTSLCVMAPLAYQGLSLPLTYDFLNELSPGRPSVLGTAMIQRHFAAGETAPVTILALKRGAGFDTAAGEREIALLTKDLYRIKGIESVRSIAEPTGDPPGYFQPFRSRALKKLAARRHKITKATYVTRQPELAGDVARFDLILAYNPFAPAAMQVVNQVQADLTALGDDPKSAWHGARFSLLGTTVGIRDLREVTQSDQRLIQQLVVLAVLAVLIIILRRPVVCLYLILSVLFSYFVTIGATKWFFTWWYGATFYGLDWKVPIFLFVILIAVGEDYNIYLVTRVFEEQRRHGPLKGLQLAVARTGGIISSCGAIMAGTFISMMAGTLRGMFELGFALSLGVILDTVVVRPVLVPAFLALVERIRLLRQPADVRAEAEAALHERFFARL